MRWTSWVGGLLLLFLSGCRCGGASQNCTPSNCEQLGKNCGAVDDGCGYTISCGYCGGGLSCGGDGIENVCGGTLSCARSSCRAADASCGEIPDGCSDTLTCGFCPAGLRCGSDTHTCDVPACQPRSCSQAGAECGVLPDGCGGSLDCGPASACVGGFCGGGGPNRCGNTTCTPLTACPTDGCGVVSDGCGDILTCGACAGGLLCTVTGQCVDAGRSIGQACTADDQCPSGTCLAENQSGWPGGYCTSPCTSDAQCGSGASCAFVRGGSGLCVNTCTATCRRTGYLCSDADGDGQRECVPGGTGGGGVGDACTSVAECAGGASAVCIPDPQGGPGGTCSVGCGIGAVACPAGSHCGFTSGSAICVKSCLNTDDCRTGFLCGDWDADGILECRPGGTIGDPCAADSDCAVGTCAGASSGYPGGYCTTACTSPGSCPPGATCGQSGQCERSCSSNLDCRSGGYACVQTGTTTTCVPYGSGSGGAGAPCQTVADCAGGTGALCLGASPGTQGYCATGCASNGDCPPGARCTSGTSGTGRCEAACGSDADCPAAFACTAQEDGSFCLPESFVGGSGQVGDACTESKQCAGLICLPQSSRAWRGGYCTAGCGSGSPCPNGSHCSTLGASQGIEGGMCFKSCASDGECGRQGMRCWDHDGDGAKECAAYAGGAGATGDPCTALDECGGGPTGLCFLPADFPEGYCSQDCAASGCAGTANCSGKDPVFFCMDAQCCEALQLCDLDKLDGNMYPDCPLGSACQRVLAAPPVGFNTGYCVQAGVGCGPSIACPDGLYCSADSGGECLICTGADRCRPNYDCFDLDRRQGRECWPAGKGSGMPGSPCSKLLDCGGGVHGRCITEDSTGLFKGGYCIRDCTDGTPCPGGSTCIDFDSTGPIKTERYSWCLDSCTADNQCRPGYTCLSINAGRSKACFPPIN